MQERVVLATEFSVYFVLVVEMAMVVKEQGKIIARYEAGMQSAK